MRTRGKFFALSMVAVGAMVLVAAGIAAKDWIREEWYLYKLWAGDLKEQTLAAKRLGELGSIRALPALFCELSEYSSKNGVYVELNEDIPEEGPSIEYYFKSEAAQEEDDLWSACAFAIGNLVNKAPHNVKPILLEGVRSDSAAVRAFVCNLFIEIVAVKEHAKEVLPNLLQDEDPTVRKLAIHTLKKIQTP